MYSCPVVYTRQVNTPSKQLPVGYIRHANSMQTIWKQGKPYISYDRQYLKAISNSAVKMYSKEERKRFVRFHIYVHAEDLQLNEGKPQQKVL
jgi:hypothetical protein